MSRFHWAVDGYGRAHLFEEGQRFTLFSMLPGNSGYLGRCLLEDQDEETPTEFIRVDVTALLAQPTTP